MNRGQVDLNRELGDVEFSRGQNKNMLEDRNRQSQLEYQETTNERKIQTQGAMNQHEFSRNQNSIETKRTQGQIDMNTRAGLSRIEQDTVYNKFQMTQQDRGHKLEMEGRMGQVQNQTLADKFLLTQQDRGHQLQTEQIKGDIQQKNLEAKLGTNLNYLQYTHQEKLNYQNRSGNLRLGEQAQSKQIDLNYHQNRLGQQAQGKQIDLNYHQNRLGQQAQGKQIDLNHHQARLGQQEQGNNMEMQKQGFIHQNKMSEYAAQDNLNTRKVQGAYLTQQFLSSGNHARHVDNLQYKQLGG
jgi:hypothetical protein